MPQITLKAARVNAGYTQKEAAKLLHISNKTLQNWESGKSYPNADKIAEICILYQIPYDCINFLPKCSLKAKKYPRIDKIEFLANYFGILKSDLIEENEDKKISHDELQLTEGEKAFIKLLRRVPAEERPIVIEKILSALDK